MPIWKICTVYGIGFAVGAVYEHFDLFWTIEGYITGAIGVATLAILCWKEAY